MSSETTPLVQQRCYQPIASERVSRPAESFGTRHVQILLLFLGITIAFGIRVCMSVTIVAMTDSTSAHPSFPDFNWDTKTCSMILSSFFWGYITTQIPSGYFARTYTAQKLLAFGIFMCSMFNLLIPVMAIRLGWVAVICCRVVTGMFQGCLFPCVQTLLSRWVPPAERARLGAIVMSASAAGTVVAMPLSGVLCASRLGWPSVFYVFGALGIVWSILFFHLGADTPSQHPTIHPSESRYIDYSLGRLNADAATACSKHKVPWGAILTSLPMWSIIITHCGNAWGVCMLLTEMPTYMNSILGFDVSQSGWMSSLPFLAGCLIGFPIGLFSDMALKRGASVECVRKISNTIGLWVPALSLVILCNLGTHDRMVVVLMLVITVGFNAGTTCGFQINHIDLSASYAGIMISITVSIANVFGTLAPMTCGMIVRDLTDTEQWHVIFYITALIYFLTNLMFIIFGKAETQSWSAPDLISGLQRKPAKSRRVSRLSSVYDPTIVMIVDSE